jgi:TfoX/Sxy family transcriptional regulator of competence genes
MAWIKIPAENHPLFHASLPKDPRISTLQMFGGVAGLVNGNMFSGLFARSALVKLGEADYAEAMKLDGAEPFDPMGRGHVMSNTVLLPETIMDEPDELRGWIRKAFDYAVTLPPKKKKGKAGAAEKSVAAKPTKATAPSSKPSSGRASKVTAAKASKVKTANASKTKTAKRTAKPKPKPGRKSRRT